jgi:hypothetical protein
MTAKTFAVLEEAAGATLEAEQKAGYRVERERANADAKPPSRRVDARHEIEILAKVSGERRQLAVALKQVDGGAQRGRRKRRPCGDPAMR